MEERVLDVLMQISSSDYTKCPQVSKLFLPRRETDCFKKIYSTEEDPFVAKQ